MAVKPETQQAAAKAANRLHHLSIKATLPDDARHLLNAISALSSNTAAITDTIWMPLGNCTVVEVLAMVAARLGASDKDIESATAGKVFITMLCRSSLVGRAMNCVSSPKENRP